MGFDDKSQGRRDRSRACGRFYESESVRYDAVRWHSYAGAWVDEVQKRIVRSMLDSSNPKTVLELAIGTGRIGIDLACDGWQMIGVDIAFNMLQRAKEKAVRAAVDAQVCLIQGDAMQIPVASESLDLCLCVNALSLIPEYEEVLKEMARTLKPGGVLICNFANLLSYYLPFGLIVNCRKRSLARDVPSRWYRLRELRRQFDRAGFEIGDVQGHIHVPNYLNAKFLLPLIKGLDKVSRNSSLRYVCPSLFFKLIKR